MEGVAADAAENGGGRAKLWKTLKKEADKHASSDGDVYALTTRKH